ncbi:MAG TPA: LLM class F420-dependent oxidoreductase [Bacillota bacterium]
MTVKFGLILTIWRLTVADAEALTVQAEEAGWDGVFIPDHIAVTPDVMAEYGPHWPDDFSLLGYLAAKTSRVDLGTSVIIVPYRNPLQQAQMVATLDQITGGRFIFGVGAGWAEQEFAALGVPFDDRGKITDEYLQVMKQVWSEDVSSFEGRFCRFKEVHVAPPLVQQPHPPIWVGGTPLVASRPSIRRAVRFGHAWHPVFLPWDELEKGAAWLREEREKAGRPDVTLVPRNMLKLTDEPLGDDRPPFHGTPEQVAADIRRAEALGATYITFDPAPMPVDDVKRLIARFAAEVVPALA